jgi:hypothetical protein
MLKDISEKKYGVEIILTCPYQDGIPRDLLVGILSLLPLLCISAHRRKPYGESKFAFINFKYFHCP